MLEISFSGDTMCGDNIIKTRVTEVFNKANAVKASG